MFQPYMFQPHKATNHSSPYQVVPYLIIFVQAILLARKMPPFCYPQLINFYLAFRMEAMCYLFLSATLSTLSSRYTDHFSFFGTTLSFHRSSHCCYPYCSKITLFICLSILCIYMVLKDKDHGLFIFYLEKQ